MERIKILFVMENLNAGGAEKVFLNIINNIDRGKFNPILLLFNTGESTKESYPFPENTEVIILKKNKKKALFLLINVIKKENPDVVFSNLAPINILCGMAKIIIRKPKIKFIFRETTIRSTSINMAQRGFIEKIIYTKLVKRFYKKAEKIISLSLGAKLDLVENFHIPASNIKVIYNPLDIKKVINLSDEKIDDNKLNENKKNIIIVGTLTKSKGHKYLIEAIRILTIEKALDIHLYIVGTGELEKSLKELVIKKNIESRVSFVGFKSNPYKYIKKCDIFILPALWEGFGNVIVEAMASSTPVISTNCESGPKEIIESEKNGLIVEMKNSVSIVDAVERLLNDNDLYSEIQKNAFERAFDFDIRTIISEYEDEIIKTMKNR